MIEIAGFNCRLVRRNGKTLRLTVSGNGKISIYAPKKASQKQIIDFVTSHSGFLTQAVKKQLTRHDSGLFGDTAGSPFIYYKGEKLPVSFSENTDVRPNFSENGLLLPGGLSANEYRSIIAELYRPLAKEHITKRAMEISAEMGIPCETLRFAKSTSRWGSRSSRGTLSFSVYLMAVSPRCIDHVIRHELTHCKVMNHSADFYALLAKHEPNHRELQNELQRVYGKWLTKFRISAS